MAHEQTVSLQALIKWALEEDTEREIAALPQPRELEALYPDTAAFRARVFSEIGRRQKAERRRRKPLRLLKRTLLAAAILTSILFCTLMTNAALRAAVVNTIIDWTDRDMGIRFEIEGEPLSALPEGYGPHYIPDRFEFLKNDSAQDISFLFYTYQTPDGSSILDIQIQLLENGSMTWIDNEHTKFEQITFNNTSAYLGHSISVGGDEIYILIWPKDGIEHLIYGTVSLSELFEIAENIY